MVVEGTQGSGVKETVEKTFVFPGQSQGKQGPQRSKHLP